MGESYKPVGYDRTDGPFDVQITWCQISNTFNIIYNILLDIETSVSEGTTTLQTTEDNHAATRLQINVERVSKN